MLTYMVVSDRRLFSVSIIDEKFLYTIIMSYFYKRWNDTVIFAIIHQLFETNFSWTLNHYYRKKQGRDHPASWEEQKAEADHRERIRHRQEANRKKAVVWDDADERKCQERYRKKYSSCN